jgi:integrase/recombinase XerD
MLEDMAVRKFNEATCRNYIRHIAEFAKFLGRSPDAATADDVRRFQVHMSESGVRAPTLNTATSALRFFFGTTLDRPELARHLARVHYPRPLPRVLSPEEVGRLLEAAPGPGLKYKAALSIAYGAGLRAGEVVILRVSDIDSKRMLIRVEQARVARTDTPCSHHSCSSCSEHGGCSAAQRVGCFLVAIRSCRSRHGSSIVSATWRQKRQA